MNTEFNFNDIIKKSVLNLEAFRSLSYVDLLWGLLIALLVGLFIYWVYRKCYRGVVYSHNYNMTFVLMTIITALIIMTISTNIVLSLGMVGALSIVRFRTAVKDPMDIVYMFWAISAGIAAGAKIYPVAVGGSLVVGAVIWWLSRRKENGLPYLLIVHYDEKAEDEVKRRIRKIHSVLKSKTIKKSGIELTVEIKMQGDNLSLMNELSAVDGVQDVVVVSYNGDYAQ
ncbi:DUF4956 domain-containing protein [Cohnella xylanilytica]|uniref:DUF4956 domain-containing protein n=1 Tax=Cohnella xylanilytica TaxID=557555 RepID=A0A841TZI3_9BACL|nr:DUF4956 domain-containing protein [Cohnella xylanilytica]MBB6691533.1 DUF4956 domain-containing protein [Cohnella xylanilytica]GIO12902.1 DUF4956 domain-containing protein [Cohnella xylanilytica]